MTHTVLGVDLSKSTVAVADNVTAIVRVDIDQDWLDFVANVDIFRNAYCGSWLFGFEFKEHVGWLCCEHEEDSPEPAENETLRAWLAGEPLPKGWHRLDAEVAAKAFAEGVRLRGVGWYESADGYFINIVMQLALFGEVRYE